MHRFIIYSIRITMCENIFITIVGEHHIPPPKQIFLYKCMLSNIRKNTWSFRTTSIDSNECDSISHEIILPSDLLPHNCWVCTYFCTMKIKVLKKQQHQQLVMWHNLSQKSPGSLFELIETIWRKWITTNSNGCVHKFH